jgi:hypothetical protein
MFITHFSIFVPQYEEDRGRKWEVYFMEKLLDSEKHKQSQYNVMTRDAYNQLLAEVEKAKSAVKKTSSQYRRFKRFYVLETCEMKTLVLRGETVKSYLPVEEIYDVIEAALLAVGHEGRDRLKMETTRIYVHVTTEMINNFLSMCETCQQKKKLRKRKAWLANSFFIQK